MSKANKLRIVDEMVAKLKLRRCENTWVGSSDIKGISGGEKRRLNIGVELLSNPKILYLDEPTSGLDSFTSFLIIKLLRNLAWEKNMVIIYTIH